MILPKLSVELSPFGSVFVLIVLLHDFYLGLQSQEPNGRETEKKNFVPNNKCKFSTQVEKLISRLIACVLKNSFPF